MRRALRSRHMAAAVLLLLLFGLNMLAGMDPLAPSPYNSYTRQALAWREGQTHLPEDVPHLELAIRDGRYYVSFPPVPSVPIYFLTYIFGAAVPDGLLVKTYALIAFYALCRAFMRQQVKEHKASWLAFLFCTASSMLPLMLSGAVWYQAQVMGFMFIALSIDRMQAKKVTSSLFCYALAVGCRPFSALYGPLLMLIHLFFTPENKGRFKQTALGMLPGVFLGLIVAAAYGWYNQIRFGSPFEFGHNFLPEFSFQGGTQFSLRHVMNNIRSFVFSLPFERTDSGIEMRRFGFSLFIANPILLWLLIWALEDALLKKMNAQKALVLLFFLAHLTLLLMHRTFGGFQYGARYAVDLIPYAAIYLWLSDKKERRISLPFLLSLCAALVFAIYGSLTIILPG